MTDLHTRVGDVDAAEEAARLLFNWKKGQPPPAVHEPVTDVEARAAVRRLGELFDELPGAVRAALDAAGEGASDLSGDRLQGVSEVIQNADDAHATRVRIAVYDGALLLAHDGRPLTLRDVLALAMPWLTTKDEDERAVGRFGIGLMTLRALAPSIDIHCGPYHVRVGAPTVEPIAKTTVPSWFAGEGWTVLRVPVDADAVGHAEVEAWLSRWDDIALLFLQSVESVELLRGGDGELVRELSLRWAAEGSVPHGDTTASLRRATGRAGGEWLVCTAQLPIPHGVRRARKAVADSTPIGIALPLFPVGSGALYAGLPVTRVELPVRANAQLDPLASRQGLAPTAWNDALVPLLGDLWATAMLHLFATRPGDAWRLVPLPTDQGAGDRDPIAVAVEKALLTRARSAVAPRVTVGTPDGERTLGEVAVEVEPLEGVLSADEVAELSESRSALPLTARDDAGRWRAVLKDWAGNGCDVPASVTVPQAASLLGDARRDAEETLALAAVVIAAGVDQPLVDLPWVTLAEGSRIAPPAPSEHRMLVSGEAPLAEQLGLAAQLHGAYAADTSDSRAAREWLRKRGAVLDSGDASNVVARLAAAGAAGLAMAGALLDDQARALRDAFEALPADDRTRLGPGVGQAIRLRSFSHDHRGRKVPGTAAPAEAYLPKSIDKDGRFAEAAATTPGISWLDPRYADILRSPTGRTGVGAQRFLRLLGAETAPRVRPHPGRTPRYQDPRLGVPAAVADGPAPRREALALQGASYTLDDYDSPDLAAVTAAIASDRQAGRRRRRADALVATLARGWERLADYAEVAAADDYGGWVPKGHVRAYWLWSAADTPWLDDVRGTPRRPLALRLHTSATVAVYGDAAPGYLRPEFDLPNRRAVLAALGVTGDPTTVELVERLRAVRAATAPAPDAATEAAVVYRAIAEKLTSVDRAAGSLSAERLRTAFTRRPGLIHTASGWRTPPEVLLGPPIFGARRAFVPVVAGSEALWAALRVPAPAPADCVNVLSEIARERQAPRGDDEAVMLETLRRLASAAETGPLDSHLVRRMRRLLVWTTAGWSARPVYACDDPVIAAGLSETVPVWRPGGGLTQFRSLLGPLGIEEISTGNASVSDPDHAHEDESATSVFRDGLQFLRDDLARNDHAAAESLTLPWDELLRYVVRVDASLAIRIHSDTVNACFPVLAKADAAHRALFVADPALVLRADGGGSAVAALFKHERRSIAQAWRAACERAETGHGDAALVLAQEKARAEAAATAEKIEARTAALRDQQRGSSRRPRPPAHPPAPTPLAPSGGPKSRTLVDPAALRLRGGGAVVTGSPTPPPPTPRRTQQPPLREPNRLGRPPQDRRPPRPYTDLTKEGVGYAIAESVLAGSDRTMVDIRAQRGVGADAIDDLDRYFELKVSVGAEPDKVTLTNAEVQRALTTPDFFLVVVSGIEGENASPRVRVIVDPLHQLRPTDSGSITLSGVTTAHSLVFDFEHDDGGAHGEE